MVVTVTATYVNHDNYPSPISVVDLTNWQTTYGTSISGSASDNNDGTMTGTVAIQRAGTYTLTVQIDSVNVIGSPYSSLEVEPYNINAPTSVAKNVPTSMTAGYSYDFQVQARDSFSNNLAKTLSNAVGSSHSVTVALASNPSTTFTGTLSDDTSTGIYKVDMSLPKTQTVGIYDYSVLLSGLAVPTS